MLLFNRVDSSRVNISTFMLLFFCVFSSRFHALRTRKFHVILLYFYIHVIILLRVLFAVSRFKNEESSCYSFVFLHSCYYSFACSLRGFTL